MQSGSKNPTVRTETLKLLQENIRINLNDFELGNGFSEMIPKPKVTTTKINQISPIKIFVYRRTPVRK